MTAARTTRSQSRSKRQRDGDGDGDGTGNSSSDTSAEKERAKQASLAEEERRLRLGIVRRDLLFLLAACAMGSAMGWIELHAPDARYRWGTASTGRDGDDSGADASEQTAQQQQIVDTGFIWTESIHDFLRTHKPWNDCLAFINTIVCVLIPIGYIAYQTVWIGDYEPAFRYGYISLMRSTCGWFTYLPPDPTYLASNYDFPDIVQCLSKDCSGSDPDNVIDGIKNQARQNKINNPVVSVLLGVIGNYNQNKSSADNPFVSFFSGHVATLVVAANHMYRKGGKYRHFAVALHCADLLQIARLLATRGHYSIDIIIGFLMGSKLSNPAGKLGRYFSRRKKMGGNEDQQNEFYEAFAPSTWKEAL